MDYNQSVLNTTKMLDIKDEVIETPRFDEKQLFQPMNDLS
jgi:hypothetical protein